jgi:DNA-binding NarL/FixJ family response regulator
MPLEEVVAEALADSPGAMTPDSAPASGPDPAVAAGLSPREGEVLRLLADGRTNAEIGETLFISPRTAGTHVANILNKLGVGSRAAAVAVAHQRGIVAASSR